MRIRSRRTFRQQLTIAACGLFVPLVLSLLWSANRTHQERAGELAGYAASVATSAGALLEQSFRSLDVLATALVRHPAVMALDPQAARLFAEIVREQPLLTNVLLAAPDGSIRAAGSPLPATGDSSPSWVGDVVRAAVDRDRRAAAAAS